MAQVRLNFHIVRHRAPQMQNSKGAFACSLFLIPGFRVRTCSSFGPPSVPNGTVGRPPAHPQHPQNPQHIPAALPALSQAVAGQDMLDPVPVPSEGAVSYFIMHRFSRLTAPAGGNVGTGWSAERSWASPVPWKPARAGPMTFDCSIVRFVFCFPSLHAPFSIQTKIAAHPPRAAPSPFHPPFPKPRDK
jgi:hypothetical protein